MSLLNLMSRVIPALLLLLSVLLLASCGHLFPPSKIPLEQKTLQEQLALLESQRIQLQTLALAQEDLMAQLGDLQAQLNDIHTVVTSRDEPFAPETHWAEPVLTSIESEHIQPEMPAQGKVVVGRVEWVWLDLAGARFKARIDTGASSSSLSATDIQPFERNGDKWVRFRIPGQEPTLSFETPLLRYKKIRQSSVEVLDKRPVVKLMARVGEINEEVEFNLTDRDSMLYPVLLGRNFLRDIAIVDVARKFTQPKVELLTP